MGNDLSNHGSALTGTPVPPFIIRQQGVQSAWCRVPGAVLGAGCRVRCWVPGAVLGAGCKCSDEEFRNSSGVCTPGLWY
jgi:hypothetical protein